MSATTVTTTTTTESPAVDATVTTTTTTPPAAAVKAKRKSGGGRKKKAAAVDGTEAKVAPATTIAPPVAAAAAAKPKVPRINAHQLFASERKPELKKEHPGVKAAEIVKLLSAEWKALEGEGRADYEKRAGEQKRQYEAKEKAEAEKVAAAAAEAAAALAAAAEAAAGGKKKKGGKKRKAKDGETTTPKVKRVTNGIKRPMSAYMYFTKHFKFDKKDDAPAPAAATDAPTDGTEKKMSQSGHKMGGKWNSMTAEEKQKYVDMAAVDKLRYANEKAAYDLAHPKPPKVQTRAHSAYIIFTQERRPLIKAANEDITFKEMGVKLGEEWTVVKQDPAKKQKYVDEREKQKEQYKKPTVPAATTTVAASA